MKHWAPVLSNDCHPMTRKGCLWGRQGWWLYSRPVRETFTKSHISHTSCAYTFIIFLAGIFSFKYSAVDNDRVEDCQSQLRNAYNIFKYRIFPSITRTLCITRTQYFPFSRTFLIDTAHLMYNAHPVFSVLTNFFNRYRAPYVYRARENTWNRSTGCGQARI
jgi:hypothetical protein